MTKKYVDGAPLARQEKIWARQGVELSRATMANWVIQCTQTWLKHLYRHMKQQLMAFLDYGDVPIFNNLAENAIRLFVVGRKNWLFCDSVKGAQSSAIVYSLVETAKANGIEHTNT